MPQPWDDLKVAYGVNDSRKAWRTFSSIDGRHSDLLPAGWELIETDDAGARCVAVFRVEFVTGDLFVSDGRAVRRLISRFKI